MSSTSPGPNGTAHVEPGWYADPNGRFDLRYHNGTVWTADVSSDGRRFVDPLGAAPTPADRTERTPRATAAMILGIIAVSIGWLPYIAVAGAACALLAIGLGIAARRAAGPADRSGIGASRARIGITTGVVGIVVAAVGIGFTVVVARAIDRYVDPNPNRAAITSCTVGAAGAVTAAGELTNLGGSTGSFTVRVAVVRAGTDNVHRTGRVELDGVAPQETVTFEVVLKAALEEPECRIDAVDGPLPFGIDFPT